MSGVMRTFDDVKLMPVAGDVFTIVEREVSPDGEPFNAENMIRIIHIAEDRAWVKEYGEGHRVILLSALRARIAMSPSGEMVRAGCASA